MTSRTETFWNFLKHQELYTPKVEQLHGSELEKMAAQFKSMEGYSQSYGHCKREVKKHNTLNQKRAEALLKNEMYSGYGSGRCVAPTMNREVLTYPRAPSLKPGTIAPVSFNRRPRYISWSLNSTRMNASGCQFGLKDPVEMAAKHVYQAPQLPEYSSHRNTSKLQAHKKYNEFLVEEKNLRSPEQYSPLEYGPCPRVVEYGELSSCGPFIMNQKVMSPTCETLVNTHIPSNPPGPTLSKPNRSLAINQAQYNRVILRSYKSNHRSPFNLWGICRSSRLQRTILRIKNKLRRGSDFKRRMGGRKFGFLSVEREPYSTVHFEDSSNYTYSSEFLEPMNLESELALVSDYKEEILYLIMPTMKAVFASLLSQYAEAPQEEYERAARDLVLDVCLKRIDFFTLVPRWEFLGLCADLNETLLQDILWDCMLEGRKIVDEYRSCNGIGFILSSFETDLEDEDVTEGYSSFEGPEEVFVQTVHLSDAAECSSHEKDYIGNESLTEDLIYSNDEAAEQTVEGVEAAEDDSGRWTEDPYSTHDHSINPWIESTYELGVCSHRADEFYVDIEASDISQALPSDELRSSKLSYEAFAGPSVGPGFFVLVIEDEKETRLDFQSATDCNQILPKDSEVSNFTKEPITQSHPLGPVIQHTGQELTNYKNSEICETSSKVTIPSEGACAFSALSKNKDNDTVNLETTQGVLKEPLQLPPALTFKKTVPGNRIRNIVNQFDSMADIPRLDLKPGG